MPKEMTYEEFLKQVRRIKKGWRKFSIEWQSRVHPEDRNTGRTAWPTPASDIRWGETFCIYWVVPKEKIAVDPVCAVAKHLTGKTYVADNLEGAAEAIGLNFEVALQVYNSAVDDPLGCDSKIRRDLLKATGLKGSFSSHTPGGSRPWWQS